MCSIRIKLPHVMLNRDLNVSLQHKMQLLTMSIELIFKLFNGRLFLATDIQPTDWRWKISNDRYVPIQTDLQPAPDEILNVVRCKCKVERRRPCSTQLCSCMKHGLSCVAACKNCYGDQCENVAETDNDDLPSEEESNIPTLKILSQRIVSSSIFPGLMKRKWNRKFELSKYDCGQPLCK